MMKKLINNAYEVTNELVEGFVRLNGAHFRRVPGMTVLVRKEMPRQGRVGIVIGGGSGHEPLFVEFVGRGMGDAAALGAIFTSPGPNLILEATRAVNGGAGVLYVYGNYAGDNMNFDLASEMAESAGIAVRTVRVWDDIASGGPGQEEDRRGTAADLFVIKVAGASAERGWSLDEVYRVTGKARDSCRSLGVALSSCTLPAVGKPLFSLNDDEMMLGMGLHGEPGMETLKLLPADETCTLIMDRLIPSLPLEEGDEVNLLVNGYGSTTRMELLIMARCAHRLLTERGIRIHDGFVGNFCTSQEMAGCSITLMKLDKELKSLWDDPAWSPGFSRVTERHS